MQGSLRPPKPPRLDESRVIWMLGLDIFVPYYVILFYCVFFYIVHYGEYGCVTLNGRMAAQVDAAMGPAQFRPPKPPNAIRTAQTIPCMI